MSTFMAKAENVEDVYKRQVLDLLVNLVFFLLVVRAFLGLQQGSEHDVLECGVLREQIERLEHLSLIHIFLQWSRL